LVDRYQVDLLVAGTHAREGLKRILLGSMAEQIFRQARCPVLTVGPHVEAEGAAAKMRHILYATDFSAGSLHALPYALSLAQENQADITLLHLVQAMPELPPSYEERMVQDSYRRLHELLPPDVELWCKPKFRVEYGFPVEAILKVAAEQCSSLIVMGVHHAGAAASHAPWAVVHRVVCHAPCPVLTVRGD
jgi:nucleotide-binding universal stress UspA family protein